MADNRESRKQKITEKRQGQILDAAREVFSEKGYSAATVPEIAKLAGVATGTIYLYYPSKRDLFIALMKKTNQTVSILETLGKIPAAGFPAIFRTILQNKLTLARNVNISTVLSLWGDIQREPELKSQMVQQIFRPATTQIEEFYRTRMEAGEYRRLNPAIVARAVQAMVAGLTILDRFEGDDSPLQTIPPDELADQVLDILLKGLLNPEKT